MTDKERIAYMCGSCFVYQGDMVSIPRPVEVLAAPGRDERVVGVVLGMSLILNSEPHDHLRVLVEDGVYVVPRRLVIPWFDV